VTSTSSVDSKKTLQPWGGQGVFYCNVMDDAFLLELPDDPVQLKRLIVERDALLAQRDTVIAQRDESIQLLSQDNQLLRHRLAVLLRSSYGPRGERFDPRQLLLFGLLVPRIESSAPAQSPGKSPSANRSKHGRQKLPDHLPRLPIEHDLDDSEKACPCCGETRQRIGQEKNEQLEHLSSNFVVLEHIRHKYACPHCNSGKCQTCDGKAHIEVAAKPAEGVDKCLAGPGLLAHVVTSKLADHLPLYRIEQIFSRQQVNINRSTLCGWVAAAARVVEPLYKLMCDRVRQSDVMHTDDTTVPIQHQGHCRQGRLWTYVGDKANPYIVYDFTPTRSGQGPLAWLGKWQGFLQADAYAGYDKLYARGDVIEVACWAHTRRKFFDAQESDPARSLWMLEMIRRLYAVEAEAKDRPPANRLLRRQLQSTPILEQIRLWMIAQQAQVLPRSPIAQAIGYALNQWAALIIYTTDARLNIDNNVAERALRRVAVGRKNWLWTGTDDSAVGHAVLWTLIASAQRYEIDVQLYLRSVLAYLPALPPDELPNYMPDVWKRDLMAEQQATLKAHQAKLARATLR
jgi:transposase